MARLRWMCGLAIWGLLLGGRAQAEELADVLRLQAESPAAEMPPAPLATAQPMSPLTAEAFSTGWPRPSSRLYDAPNMFGDPFSPGGKITYEAHIPVLIDGPTILPIFDPVILRQIEQQLTQDATNQAQQQLIDQQNNPPVDPTAISVTVALPDLTGALVAPVREVAFISAQGMVDLQLAGGTRRTKIAENNHTLPQDRVFLFYNHFHNAIASDEFRLPTPGPTGTVPTTDILTRRNVQSLNRYTLGLEKTFEEGQSSVEFRLPLIGDVQRSEGFDVLSDGGNVGNFAIILKRLFFTAENFAAVAGLGINLPTGSDARGSIADVNYEVVNEAIYFLPYVGVAGAPADPFFYQAFAQMDIAGWGNPVDVRDRFGRARVGRLNDQTLLFLDASAGAWLYRNPASRLAGIASLLELHYTTTLQDADDFGVLASRGNSLLFFGNPANRQDILNGTVGLHTILQNGTSLRIGGVFPLRQSDDNRLFDAEVQAAINVPF